MNFNNIYNKLLCLIIFILLSSYTKVFAIQNILVYGQSITNNNIKLTVSAINDQEITDEINFDLTVSGAIAIQNNATLPTKVNFNLTVQLKPHLNYTDIIYTLTNKTTNKIISIQNGKFKANNKRKVVHMMNNIIYKNITSKEANFTSKIATIIKYNDVYSLVISDYDGYNGKSILTTKSPLSSLAWSPNNNNIAYVVYQDNKPVIYIQNITLGVRTLIANFEGSNSSPAFIDNTHLLVTLSKDEISHIYTIDNSKYQKDKTATRVVYWGQIDTEATINSEGAIAFTSDREGNPQIFLTNLKQTKPVKLTNKLGGYLTTAKFSPDGSKIALVKKDIGFRVFLYDLKTQNIASISDSLSDIAPSFSPNSSLVLYSNGEILYLSSTIYNKISALELKNFNYDEVIDQSWSN